MPAVNPPTEQEGINLFVEALKAYISSDATVSSAFQTALTTVMNQGPKTAQAIKSIVEERSSYWKKPE